MVKDIIECTAHLRTQELLWSLHGLNMLRQIFILFPNIFYRLYKLEKIAIVTRRVCSWFRKVELETLPPRISHSVWWNLNNLFWISLTAWLTWLTSHVASLALIISALLVLKHLFRIGMQAVMKVVITPQERCLISSAWIDMGSFEVSSSLELNPFIYCGILLGYPVDVRQAW